MDFSKIDLAENQDLARIIVERASAQKFKRRRDFEKFRNGIVKEYKGCIFHNLYLIKAYNDLLKEGKISQNPSLLSFIQKRSVRTMSGVAPVTVMTKPFPCPGRCVYCPTDVRMPKSYLPTQPAAQRAFRQRFHPYTQVFVRLKALAMTGHEVSKVELRVIGGTWSSYPKKYQTWFIKQCLLAMNEFKAQISDEKTDKMANITKKQYVESVYGVDEVNTVMIRSLNKVPLKIEQVIAENELSEVRCIGVNIETRPDFISEKEIKRLRKLGVTKVEIGVQTTDDKVQALTKRGHGLEAVRRATSLLKDAGFKIGYHMMPNLPGSSIELDKRMVGDLFTGAEYQPDYLKIYPCVVIPGTELSETYQKGEYEPYDDKTLEEVLLEEMRSIPEWCRVDRVARDIPANDIEAGFKVSNIRQVLEERLIKEGTPCRDIRSREVQNVEVNPSDIELVVRSYEASGGREYFISYEDVKKDKLVALIRLRLPGRTFIKELKGVAIVREVHVYGRQIPVGKIDVLNKQHSGWGTRLLCDAEEIARQQGFKRMAIIAGIGTRDYYRKRGYQLVGTYMLKNL